MPSLITIKTVFCFLFLEWYINISVKFWHPHIVNNIHCDKSILVWFLITYVCHTLCKHMRRAHYSTLGKSNELTMTPNLYLTAWVHELCTFHTITIMDYSFDISIRPSVTLLDCVKAANNHIVQLEWHSLECILPPRLLM